MKKKHFAFLLLSLIVVILSTLSIQGFYCKKKLQTEPPFLKCTSLTLDSLEMKMTLEAKLMNCFLIKNDNQSIFANLLTNMKPAGVVLSTSENKNIKQEIENINGFKKSLFFIAIDNLVAFENSLDIPAPILRGCNSNLQTIQNLGSAAGEQLKKQGVNFVLTNSLQNCLSPTPSQQTYHSDFELSVEKCTAFNKGIVSENIILSSEYTTLDPQCTVDKSILFIQKSKDQLANALTFKKFGKAYPSFVSSKSLKDSLRFKGLIVSDLQNLLTENQMIDALNSGELFIVKASEFQAVFELAMTCLQKNEELKQKVNKANHRILLAQNWAKIKPCSAIEHNLELNKRLTNEQAFIYLGEKKTIPIVELKNKKILLIEGDTLHPYFFENLELYTKIEHQYFNTIISEDSIKQIIKTYQHIIILPTNPNMNKFIHELSDLSQKKQLIIFAPIQACKQINFRNLNAAILTSLHTSNLVDELAGQAIFGGFAIQGQLPFKFSSFQTNDGFKSTKTRLQYSIPESVGIRKHELDTIEKIVMDGIKQLAFPGCQVFLAKNGIVFYNKSFGKTTYEAETMVTNNHLYDLASVTKIAASVPALMLLEELGEIKIDEKIQTYLPELKETDKANMQIRKMLLHEAGLPIWMPYFHLIFNDKKNNNLNPAYFSTQKSTSCSVQISDHLYINPTFANVFLQSVYKVKLKDNLNYDYTDLAYYFFKEAIERKSKMPLDQFTKLNFYASLGANKLCFNPLSNFSKNNIVPTENDPLVRKELIQAYVHDPGAALMGGVAGHAGLFSNANDLAKLMQMYLQMGEYGGLRYLSKKTIETFTQPLTKQNCNRGLGFDKQRNGVISKMVSPQAYGHTGFTGTIAWNDPANQLLYIFLSNRVYPEAKNNKLLEIGTRKRIQEVVYKALSKK